MSPLYVNVANLNYVSTLVWQCGSEMPSEQVIATIFSGLAGSLRSLRLSMPFVPDTLSLNNLLELDIHATQCVTSPSIRSVATRHPGLNSLVLRGFLIFTAEDAAAVLDSSPQLRRLEVETHQRGWGVVPSALKVLARPGGKLCHLALSHCRESVPVPLMRNACLALLSLIHI